MHGQVTASAVTFVWRDSTSQVSAKNPFAAGFDRKTHLGASRAAFGRCRERAGLEGVGMNAGGNWRRTQWAERRLYQAATVPSDRGSDAPSSTPFGWRTMAPAWPMVSSKGGRT